MPLNVAAPGVLDNDFDPDDDTLAPFLLGPGNGILDLRPDEMAKLVARMEAGELFFFVIDETVIESEEDLVWAAGRFLDEVERRRAEASQ